MPLAKVLSCAVVGLDGEIVECEVAASRRGLPSLAMVGLPDTAVKEAKDRVESAIKNSGFTFPHGRIVVNLAPADIRKEGPTYDLPIAVGIMVAGGQVLADVTNSVFLGELSLDGQVRHAQGILPMVALARERGIRTAYVPSIDAAEAALLPGMTVYPVDRLGALLRHLHELLTEVTGVHCSVADDPMSCVAIGTGMAAVASQMESVARVAVGGVGLFVIILIALVLDGRL
mgnify:CR=1 FL=1